jgi:predicted P-loop ATPase
MTLPSVKVRRPYDRLPVDMVRRASFVGSINNSDFLNDPTGSRRFLVFEITDVLGFQKIDMDKVYSQARALWSQGESFWFSDKEINEITERNKKYTLRTYEHELVNELCKPGNSKNGTWFTATDLAGQIGIRKTHFKVDKAPVRNIGYALTNEGYQKKCSKGSTKYLIAWKDASDDNG